MSAQGRDPEAVVETLNDSFHGVRVSPAEVRQPFVLLHFHGGGFRMGSVTAWMPFLTRFASTVGAEVISVDYSLAPEHRHPVALQEARTAFEQVTSAGKPVVLVGDSAGGNLAACLALESVREGVPRHDATVLLSPWLDLTVTNASYQVNAATDTIFSRDAAEQAARLYAPEHDLSAPDLSPGLGDWTGQPPLFLETSAAEVLRDDARRLASSAISAGVRVWFREVPGQPHDWHILDPAPAATTESLHAVSAFLQSLDRRED